MEEIPSFIILIFLNISLPISLLSIPLLIPANINFSFCYDFIYYKYFWGYSKSLLFDWSPLLILFVWSE